MRLYNVVRSFTALGALALGGCTDTAVTVNLTSPARACPGRAIGGVSAVTVRNDGTVATASLRLRWWFSSDPLPSSDDVSLAGTDSNVLLPPIMPGAIHEASSTAIVVPLAVRFGPQYLIAVVTDTADSIIGFEAAPIVLDQCPAEAACSASYDTLSAYTASPHRSSGARSASAPRERPSIVVDDSRITSGRAITVAGRETNSTGLPRGLLVRFAESGSFAWAKSISHCTEDEVTSVDTFSDGTLAVTLYYKTATAFHSELRSYSRSGQLLWILPISQCDFSNSACNAANPVVSVDTSDDTAVVASNSPGLTIVRSDRYGNELQRRVHTQFTSTPSDLDVLRTSSSRSPVLLTTFGGNIVALRPDFTLNWSKVLGNTSFGTFGHSALEVEICTPTNFYLATPGVEYFGGEHVIYNFSSGGAQRWGIRLASGARAGWAPAYTGPAGLLRAERFSLRCSEQDLPELLFVAGDDSHQTSNPRGVTFFHDGSVADAFAGTWTGTSEFAGGAGISISSPALRFLRLQSRKFSLITPASVGWRDL